MPYNYSTYVFTIYVSMTIGIKSGGPPPPVIKNDTGINIKLCYVFSISFSVEFSYIVDTLYKYICIQ